MAHQPKELVGLIVVTATWVRISKIRKRDFDVLISRPRSAIDMWEFFRSMTVGLEVEKVVLGHIFL
jgi:hypothetical protein